VRSTLRVFICSTFADLVPERRAIMDAVHRLQLIHDTMEFFGARDEMPLETCLREVAQSDVMVLVVGCRYGSTVPDLGISYSEAEYNEARRLKKPCLVFLAHDSYAINQPLSSESGASESLAKWKDLLRRQHTVDSFTSPEDLAVRVTAALSNVIRQFEDTERQTGKHSAAMIAEQLRAIDERQRLRTRTRIIISRIIPASGWVFDPDLKLEGDRVPSLLLPPGGTLTLDVMPGYYAFKLKSYETRSALVSKSWITTADWARTNTWNGELKPGVYRFECGHTNPGVARKTLFAIRMLAGVTSSKLYLRYTAYEAWPELRAEQPLTT
jgi:hypothetical protein